MKIGALKFTEIKKVFRNNLAIVNIKNEKIKDMHNN